MRTPLSSRIRERRLLSAPGVYDLISLRIADSVGFEALYMTGYGTVASSLGLPDAGLATYTEMVERVRALAGATDTPLIADGDTGYGGLINVRRTVRGYESAGAAAIQLEDQEFPKKCGHTLGRRVIPAEQMAQKIQVACEARNSEEFLIIARTDARTTLGIDEALRRAELYAKSGADVLFIESPETEEELRVIGRSFDVPLLINVVEGGRTPVLSSKELEDLGFRIAIYPASGFLTAALALQKTYTTLKSGRPIDESSLYSFSDFHRLVGFEAVWDFEKSHPEK